MNMAAQQLADELMMAAQAVLGVSGSIPSIIDLQRLHDAVIATEKACIVDGLFEWKNAKGS
jgi:hypothetical protein